MLAFSNLSLIHCIIGNIISGHQPYKHIYHFLRNTSFIKATQCDFVCLKQLSGYKLSLPYYKTSKTQGTIQSHLSKVRHNRNNFTELA